MNREQKAAVIDEVAGHIQESEAVFAVDYRGLSVPQSADLRTRLRDADATFTVVKNTLGERAADQVGADGLKEYLSGPTAITFVRGDAAAAAKALSDFRRTAGGLPVFKGGWMNGASLTADQIDAIARLPSRDVLYGQLVGMVASPLTGLATALNGFIAGIARQLQAIADQGLVPAAGASPAAAAPAAADGGGDTATPDAGDAALAAGAAAPAADPADADGDAAAGDAGFAAETAAPSADPADAAAAEPASVTAEAGGGESGDGADSAAGADAGTGGDDPDSGPASTPDAGPHPDNPPDERSSDA